MTSVPSTPASAFDDWFALPAMRAIAPALREAMREAASGLPAQALVPASTGILHDTLDALALLHADGDVAAAALLFELPPLAERV